jgi:hypothetical protein
VGCRVDICDEDGVDVVRVWRTRGSNNRGREQLIAEFAAEVAGPVASEGRFSNLDVEVCP